MRDEPDPERRLAREAHSVGMLRSEYLVKRFNGVIAQAHADGWSGETLDAALDAIEKLANEIWGNLTHDQNGVRH